MLCIGGAGAKADPTKLRFLDIAEATVDPLVRCVRHKLRKTHNITAGIDVLLSVEQPRCGLVTTEEQAAAPSMLDYQVCCAAREVVQRSMCCVGCSGCPDTHNIAFGIQCR